MPIHFYEPLNTWHQRKLEAVYEIQFAHVRLKLVSGSKPGYALSNADKKVSVSLLLHSCICTWENKHSVLTIIFFPFYDVNLNRTHHENMPIQCWTIKPHFYIVQNVREKSRECHNHKPQPFPDPKRKRKPTNLNKHKSVNWGLQGYTLFFLFLLKNIDSKNSLEPPLHGLSRNMKKKKLSENFRFWW